MILESMTVEQIPPKDASKEEFMRFWKTPCSPARSRPGIYEARIFGPEGQRVQIIMLDTRYFRSPLKKGKRRVSRPYYPDDSDTKTMLGEAQWLWLQKQLEKPLKRLLVTGLHWFRGEGQETWSNLPRERQKLFDMLKQTRAAGVLEWYRHWAELSCCTEGVPYPVHELRPTVSTRFIPAVHPQKIDFVWMKEPTVRTMRSSVSTGRRAVDGHTGSEGHGSRCVSKKDTGSELQPD